MKKSILILTATTFVAGSILMSCSSPAKKVENAENNVMDANMELDKANKEYLADVENYRTETAAKIEANNKSIVEFNARIAKEKKDAKADYQKKIAELEQKNSDMKKKMDDYKESGKENWEAFKTEFSRDMNGLGEAFKGFTIK